MQAAITCPSSSGTLYRASNASLGASIAAVVLDSLGMILGALMLPAGGATLDIVEQKAGGAGRQGRHGVLHPKFTCAEVSVVDGSRAIDW